MTGCGGCDDSLYMPTDRAFMEANPGVDTFARPYVPHEFCVPGTPCRERETFGPFQMSAPHRGVLVGRVAPGLRTRQALWTLQKLNGPTVDLPVIDL